MSQLERLAKPFPDRLIHSNPSGGGSYVKHSVVTEKLLAVLGPFDFELVEVVRGHVAAVAPNPTGKSGKAKQGSPALVDGIVGAVCRLSVVIDGRATHVEEVGDCEQPHNWPHDGARLKDAMSDALKRCAMRVGVTLHLWSGPEFSLYDQLRASRSAETEPDVGDQRALSAQVARSGETNPSSHPEPEPVSARMSTGAGEGSGRTGAAVPHETVGPAESPASVPVPVPPSGATEAGVEATSPARDASAPAPSDEWHPPAIELHDALALSRSLIARKVSVFDMRKRDGLPKLDENCDEGNFRLWQRLLADLDTANPVKANA